MDVKEIKDQGLSSLLTDFLICQHCQVIDREQERIRIGYECPTCGIPSEGGRMSFAISVRVLIDLIQEAFHSRPAGAERIDESGYEAHNVSVVLFFCTLREVLLYWLIEHLLWAHKIPAKIQERLLSDSSTHWQRQNTLLPSLVGKKWNVLVEEESQAAQLDYIELNDFIQKAVNARNKFMHEGRHWGIDRQLAEGCIDHIWPLLNLYVALHNRHVHTQVFRPANP